jgi:hypothetical protein
MDNNQKEQQQNQQQPQQQPQQQTSGEQNPTLNQPGTSVADYGNVMGGSSDENAQQGHTTGTGRQDSGETMGNP